jgi:hypothetical protein
MVQVRFCLLMVLTMYLPAAVFGSVKTVRLAPLDTVVKLQNPVNVAYLKKHLSKNTPRLILTPAHIKTLKSKLKTDDVVKNMYKAIRLNAEKIRTQPLLKREVIGRRLLSTSREMLYRMNMLCMVYIVEKDAQVLKRINEELLAVCEFSDWNPSHFLDVAEMSMAVAFAIDWVGADLPAFTVKAGKLALIEKGIKPSYEKKGMGWITGTNNWNQVCHGGMIAASIVIAEDDPDLAATTIARALDGMPHALQEYGPHGVYPEGSTYWDYGTGFSCLTSSMLESAFGTDFGLADYPAFKQSADFRLLTIAPSGWYYNFADCGDERDENGDVVLAWFAMKTGNRIYYERERFLLNPEQMEKLDRIAGAGLVWLSQVEGNENGKLPTAWRGEGSNPIVFFRGDESDSHQYYFGGKGGKATVSHGNMDAGSFVFELDGVRWSVDPGNQPYHELEKTGFNLWASCQHCDRWKLLTKNNYGHSTLTVNDKLHKADGFAPIIEFKSGINPEVTFNMTEVFGGDLKRATRRFVKEGNEALLIEDRFELNDSTRNLTWQLLTTADVQIVDGGALLRQDGKQLKLKNFSYPDISVSVISLDPPPLQLDRRIKNLKRIEIRLPAYLFSEGKGEIRVKLSTLN